MMIRLTFHSILLVTLWCLSTNTLADDSPVSKPVSFASDIRPIFQEHCHGCHQPAKPMGDYVLTTAAGRLKSGESEQLTILAGKPDESYLVEQITPVDGVAEMPKNGEPLLANQLALIRRWIEEGAIDDSPPSTSGEYDADHLPEYPRAPVITSIDYSPDGKLLAVAGFHEVLLHDPDGSTDGTPVARLIGLSERIESVRFSPDGSLLAVTGGSPGRMGEVQIWDVAKRELINSLPITFETVYGASWSPDGRLLAFGCADNSVRAINVSTGEQVLFQGAHSDWVLDTVFSADGSHVASVGSDATAKLIEVATQRFVDNITSITPGALRGGINAVARQPQRDEILFGGADGVPKIYRMHRTVKRVIGDDANLLWEFPPLPGRIFGVDYSLDGSVIAAGSSLDGKGAVHIYGIASDSTIPEAINAILVKPTHQRNDDERSTLKKHFAEGTQVFGEIAIPSGGIYAVSIHPAATRVAAAGADGQIRVFAATSGELVHEFPAVPMIQAVDSEVALAPIRGATPATSQSDTGGRETLPENTGIVRLRIEPPQVALRTSTDYVQLIVMGELSSGESIDVTRMVKLSSDACVDVTPYGMVTSLADGNGEVTACLADLTAKIPVEVSGSAAALHPDYLRDVSPVLARVGCNAGTCHGAQDGKNGFKLSLRGYDPIFDVRALTDDVKSRRTNLSSAANSLFLLKPTGSVPHQGGAVLKEDGGYYRTLLAWIQSGAALDLGSSCVSRIEIQPVNPVVQRVGTRNQMRVVAYFADGTQRDVTREAFIVSGDTEIAESVAEHPGLIEVLRRGEAPVLVRYEGTYAATTITVIGDRAGFVATPPPANNHIDDLVQQKLERTKTSTSPLCNDYTFIRRVYLDLTGLPPTPEQVLEFVDDARDSRWKRDELIDRLIGNPDYVEHWTNKWADLLQVNSKFLGLEGAEAFRSWIRTEINENRPYDQFAHDILTAEGSNREHPAASYFKTLREPEATMENTTQLFLATRFNCNKCHDHPFERWTQDQYYQLSAFFAQVGLKPDPAGGDKMVQGTAVEEAKPLYEIVYTKPEGEVTHLRTGKTAVPTFPFECDHEEIDDWSRRQRLASWITSSDNPYFAMGYANRVWAYLTGRGLIEPIDDIRAGNPPTNPELLTWLTEQFVANGFDTRHLIRTICRSRTYQLALETNPFNADDGVNYSHAKARRLPAEVLYDAIHRTTGAPSTFPGLPAGFRAAALPDVGIKLPDGFLNTLGRPARESACECERSSDLQMGPVMALINGATVGEAISHPGNAIDELVRKQADDRQLIQELFMRILNRPADGVEIDDALQLVGSIADRQLKIATELRNYEISLVPILEARRQERLAELAEKNDLLAMRIAELAPERARLAKERQQRIDDAHQNVASVRTRLLTTLSVWEQEQGRQTEWEALNPIEISSSFGEEFAVQEDGSVFVSGASGQKGSNEFIAPANLTGITGVRLEALLDDRLSHQGPGRSTDGNFVLNELKVSVSPDRSQGSSSQPSPSALIRAWDLSNDNEDWFGEEGTSITPGDGKIVVAVDQPTREKRIAVQTTAPALPLELDITAKLSEAAEFALMWQTDDQSDYVEEQIVKRNVTPGTAKWRTYRLYFEPVAPVTHLRLQVVGGGQDIAIDAVRLLQAKSPEFTPVKLQNAQADFSQDVYAVATAIDEKSTGDGNGWAISPQVGMEHTATFETSEDYAASGDGMLQIKLVHEYSSGKHSLGRFRLSITRAPRPLHPGLPGHLSEIVSIKREERSDEQQTELESHFLQSQKEFVDARAAVGTAEIELPPDPIEERLKQRITDLGQPLPPDTTLVQLQRAAELSEQQLANQRLTAAQDIAWALINCPEFLYNH